MNGRDERASFPSGPGAEDVPAGCEFWLRQDVDLIAAVESISSTNPLASVGATCCALLLLARMAVLLQNEDLHFHAHRGIARLTRWRGKSILRPAQTLLVAVLIRDWATTQYRNPTTRAVLDDLNRVRSGPRAPWTPVQMSLSLATTSDSSSVLDSGLVRYFWMAAKLAA